RQKYKEGSDFYALSEYEHNEKVSALAKVLEGLRGDDTVLSYRKEQLNEMEEDNNKSWNSYIRKDQESKEDQWLRHIQQMTKFTCQQAEAQGCWSVWVTVFKARQPDELFHIRPAVIPVLDGM